MPARKLMSDTGSPKRRIIKPLGVYFITAFDCLFIGLMPLIAMIYLSRQPDFEMPLFAFVTTITLCLIVVAASIGAWCGDNFSRLLLLGGVSGLSAMIIYTNVRLIADGEVTGSEVIRNVGNIIRGVFWIGINQWYFRRRGTVSYYKQSS